jgi:heptosyltransferase II
MALPAIADVVRGSSSGTTVDVAARPDIAPLVPLIPGIGESVVLEGSGESVTVVKGGHYDAVLLLTNSFNTARIARAAGVPERWGYRNEFRSLLLTRSVPPPSRVHQAAYYQTLTTALGFPPGSLEPQLRVSSDLRAIGQDRLAESGWDGQTPLIAVAPGAAFGGAKRWPPERFAAAIDGLARDGVRAVLVGARGDAQSGTDVLAAVRTGLRPLDLIGRTDLSSLAAVLVNTRGLLTNDSGAMHFAAALGVNVTAIFGPTNEHETRPLGSGHIEVVHTDVWCRPCMLRECPLTHRCMTTVSAEEVLRAMRTAS